ncbi:hypothetical protein CYMTET_3157 [Cymbomonas tetramitiformis]|uniref:Uncharacterized protein n=1 Tax=Cymbomonas tetramitiformis TaxID=36881 RepID=A0AAE0H5M5_9CHLO|nr:hypothetical protein CYMTET_3157 [Cymbomonas tetramitiformis]
MCMPTCGSGSGASTVKPVLPIKSAKVRVTGGGMKGCESGGPVHSSPELTDAAAEGLAAADTTAMSAVKVLTFRAAVSAFLAMSVYSVTADTKPTDSPSRSPTTPMTTKWTCTRSCGSCAHQIGKVGKGVTFSQVATALKMQ